MFHVSGSPDGRFGLKSDAGSKLESSWAQVVQKVWKNAENLMPKATFWSTLGSAWPPREGLNHFGDGLDVTLGSVGLDLRVFFLEIVIFLIRCHSAAEVLLLQVRAPKLELLAPKSQNRTVQSCKSEGPGQ